MTAEVLKPWDGRAGRYLYRDVACRHLLIASDGTIYDHDGHGQLYIWCPAVQLEHHLYRLRQVRGDDAVADLSDPVNRALRITADAFYSMAGR